MSISIVLVFLAVISFFLATVGAISKVNMVALGLMLCALVYLIGQWK